MVEWTIDRAIHAAIASGRVPPSITADYLFQSRDTGAKVALLLVGALTTIIVVLRCISRWTARRLGIDDAFACLSSLLHIAFITLSMILIDLGTGRHLQYIEYVMTTHQIDTSEVLDFTAHLIYTTALFICRLSGLFFYRRLCELHKNLSRAIKVALVLLIAAYIPQMALIVFHCTPVTALWPYSWQLRSVDYTCLTWGLVYTVNSGLSLVCDIFMFAIPMVLIQTINLPTKQKLHLYLVLLPGVLVILISIFRLYLVVEGQWRPDSSWNYNPMLAIENAEIGGTLIALSIPGLKPLFDRVSFKICGPSRNRPSSSVLDPSIIFRSTSDEKTPVTASTSDRRPTRNTWMELYEENNAAGYRINAESMDHLHDGPIPINPPIAGGISWGALDFTLGRGAVP